jgi:hypothetical protein
MAQGIPVVHESKFNFTNGIYSVSAGVLRIARSISQKASTYFAIDGSAATANRTMTLPDGDVTVPSGTLFGSSNVFASASTTATGSSQNVAHSLGRTPSKVIVSVYQGHDGAGATGTQMATIVEGTHTSTNCVVTVTAGSKFKVFAA